MTDTTTMTGAQFRREVGTDPAKWAEAFLNAAEVDLLCKSNDERAAFTAKWFRDYADACVAEAVRHTPWPLQPCPPTP